MPEQKTILSPIERFLTLFTKIRPGEGRAVLLYSAYALLLMTSYYLLKVLRDALILSEHSAEAKSYAQATIAIVLFFVIPLYGVLYRHSKPINLVRWITVFFAANILIFLGVYGAGLRIGFAFYIWVSIFSVMMFAQFWAFAADSLNVKSGQRLFPVIMAGQAIGALIGGKLAAELEPYLGIANLMLLSSVLLAATALLTRPARDFVPDESAAIEEPEADQKAGLTQNLLGGLALVFTRRYLLLFAAMVVLLNWVNSTGEYILGAFVKDIAEMQAASGQADSVSSAVTNLMGNFYTYASFVGILIQVFLVARIFRWIGVNGALLVLPIIAIVGYGLIVFIPIFSLIRLVKIFENATDYSLMNTTRQALYLPLTASEKYQGKTAIDTFFWRFGDLIQAGAIFVGLNYLGWDFTHFAGMNMLLAMVWLIIAVLIGRRYRYLLKTHVGNRSPELARAIPDVYAPPGSTLIHMLDADHFVDADPGDVLTLSAGSQTAGSLPDWLSFDANERAFRGVVPYGVTETTIVSVTATDFDGLAVSATFKIRHQDRN